jgi:hypothetical protein
MDRLPGVVPGSREPQQTPRIGNIRLTKNTKELWEFIKKTMYENRAWSKSFPNDLVCSLTDLSSLISPPRAIAVEPMHLSLSQYSVTPLEEIITFTDDVTFLEEEYYPSHIPILTLYEHVENVFIYRGKLFGIEAKHLLGHDLVLIGLGYHYSQ